MLLALQLVTVAVSPLVNVTCVALRRPRNSTRNDNREPTAPISSQAADTWRSSNREGDSLLATLLIVTTTCRLSLARHVAVMLVELKLVIVAWVPLNLPSPWTGCSQNRCRL